VTCNSPLNSQLQSPFSLLSKMIATMVILLAPLRLPAMGAPHAASSPLFLPAVNYSTGGYDPSSVAVADVNGDGVPDIVVANVRRNLTDQVFAASNIGVMLGNGDGTFQSVVTYPSGGSELQSVVIADVNNDGRPDILAANGCTLISIGDCSVQGAVGVLLGNGDGTFQPAVNYGSGGFGGLYLKVIAADMNGDGKPDLVTLNGCSSPCDSINPPQGTVGVLLGNGDGTFQNAVSYATGGYFAHSLAVADLNGDHNLDVAVTNFCGDSNIAGCTTPGPVGVLLGNGDGKLQATVSYASGGQFTSSVFIADVNEDGIPDLIVGNCGVQGCGGFWPPSGVVGVLLGRGNGTFASAATYGSGSYFTVAVADIDGDGKPDLVLANWACSSAGTGCVSLILGNGDGTFQSAANVGAGTDADTIAVADLNGDGQPDLVTAPNEPFSSNDPPGTVSVLLNNTISCLTRPEVTVSATPTLLWPPNGKLVPVTISGTINDSRCSITNVTYAVTDEYGLIQPSGPVTLGRGGAYSFTIFLRALRAGSDMDGRSYTITIEAKDSAGDAASKMSVVTVPHDHRH
jgi:hypothetical protein